MWSMVVVLVVALALIGLGYLALIKGQTIAIRVHFPFITIETRHPGKPELPPDKPELPPDDSKQ